MTVLAAVLWIVGLLLWLFLLANLGTMGNSDPAGNALASAYATFTAIGLWVVLAGLLISLGLGGKLPGPAKGAALLLIPLSGAALVAALSLLSPSGAGPRWPIVVPAVAPALILGYAIWCLVPSFRAAVPERIMTAVAAVGLVLVSLVPWPALARKSKEQTGNRQRIEAEFEARQAKESEASRVAALAKLDSLTEASPLWEWMELTDTAKGIRDRALERIRTVPRRQADAEMMLGRGYGNVAQLLPELGLEATQELCTAGRDFLQKKLESIRRLQFDAMEFELFAERIEPYLPMMTWLAARGCVLGTLASDLQSEANRFGPSPKRSPLLESIGRAGRSR
jgi:hypothetical protein